MCNLFHTHGMLSVGAGTHTVRLLPAFNITMAEAEEALSIFKTCLSEAQK
jgi:acetylornithine/succinyldiaminopimelate/putrescine aminotransferase